MRTSLPDWHESNVQRRHRKRLNFLPPLISIFLLVALATNADASPPCPSESQGDRTFDARNTNKCIWTMNDGNLLPQKYRTVYYNIYCPGRMYMDQAREAGQRMVLGAPFKALRVSSGSHPNIIVKQHKERRLTAQFTGIAHLFHYGCRVGSTPGVATHIKVGVKAYQGARCQFQGHQSGHIAPNARMDRVYHCDPHFANYQRQQAKEHGAQLMRTDENITRELRNKGLKMCVLNSTDIKCEPCNTSDTLIVRVKTISPRASCPQGTIAEINPFQR